MLIIFSYKSLVYFNYFPTLVLVEEHLIFKVFFENVWFLRIVWFSMGPWTCKKWVTYLRTWDGFKLKITSFFSALNFVFVVEQIWQFTRGPKKMSIKTLWEAGEVNGGANFLSLKSETVNQKEGSEVAWRHSWTTL